jgi:hypothetical protein
MQRRESTEKTNIQANLGAHNHQVNCPCCGLLVESRRTRDRIWRHNVQTCKLVNLALSESGIAVHQLIQVDVYVGHGPLTGYYSLSDPYTIHISEDAYSLFPEYTIFHEIKHMVDCLMKGSSEEGSPDPWARALCIRYGFRYPPPHQHLSHHAFGYRAEVISV